jgi:hypothetical protein
MRVSMVSRVSRVESRISNVFRVSLSSEVSSHRLYLVVINDVFGLKLFIDNGADTIGRHDGANSACVIMRVFKCLCVSLFVCLCVCECVCLCVCVHASSLQQGGAHSIRKLA